MPDSASSPTMSPRSYLLYRADALDSNSSRLPLLMPNQGYKISAKRRDCS